MCEKAGPVVRPFVCTDGAGKRENRWECVDRANWESQAAVIEGVSAKTLVVGIIQTIHNASVQASYTTPEKRFVIYDRRSIRTA